MDCKRVFLSEKEMPTAWYNLQADLPKPVPPPLHPGTKQPLAPGRPGADLRQGADRPGGEPRAVDRDSRAGAEGVRDLAAHAAGAGDEPGKGPEDARPHLLQGREPQPARQPQAEHGRAAGVLQQDRGHQPSDDRDRGRPVGLRRWPSPARFFDMHCKVFMVKVSYHQKPYRRSMMHIWGADGDAQPLGRDQRRPADAGRRSRMPRQPGHRHQRGGRGGRHPRRHQVHARQRAEPRHAAPDGHRPGGGEAVRAGRAISPTW